MLPALFVSIVWILFSFLRSPWLLPVLSLSCVCDFFFSFYKTKSTCWDQTQHRRKKCEMFPPNNWWQTHCIKACWKGTFFFFLEGENKGISSSTLVLLSCKLILLRGGKSGKPLVFLRILSCDLGKPFKDTTVTLKVSAILFRIEKLIIACFEFKA